jgi:hypothetical protein
MQRPNCFDSSDEKKTLAFLPLHLPLRHCNNWPSFFHQSFSAASVILWIFMTIDITPKQGFILYFNPLTAMDLFTCTSAQAPWTCIPVLWQTAGNWYTGSDVTRSYFLVPDPLKSYGTHQIACLRVLQTRIGLQLLSIMMLMMKERVAAVG